MDIPKIGSVYRESVCKWITVKVVSAPYTVNAGWNTFVDVVDVIENDGHGTDREKSIYVKFFSNGYYEFV